MLGAIRFSGARDSPWAIYRFEASKVWRGNCLPKLAMGFPNLGCLWFGGLRCVPLSYAWFRLWFGLPMILGLPYVVLGYSPARLHGTRKGGGSLFWVPC